MEGNRLGWWARPDSNRRPLPCQGSGGQQIATPQTGNQQHAGNQSGPQLDLEQLDGPLLVHALRAVIEFGVAEIMAGRIVTTTREARVSYQYYETVSSGGGSCPMCHAAMRPHVPHACTKPDFDQPAREVPVRGETLLHSTGGRHA